MTLMNVDWSELETMARTVYGEARGEGQDGKEAVANVILNRVRKQSYFGKTVEEVCRKPKQFSCWNDGDPNRAKIEAVDFRDADFRDCVTACLDAIGLDPVLGLRLVCHYHAKGVTPYWAEGKAPFVTIGNHVFYTNID